MDGHDLYISQVKNYLKSRMEKEKKDNHQNEVGMLSFLMQITEEYGKSFLLDFQNKEWDSSLDEGKKAKILEEYNKKIKSELVEWEKEIPEPFRRKYTAYQELVDEISDLVEERERYGGIHALRYLRKEKKLLIRMKDILSEIHGEKQKEDYEIMEEAMKVTMNFFS